MLPTTETLDPQFLEQIIAALFPEAAGEQGGESSPP